MGSMYQKKKNKIKWTTFHERTEIAKVDSISRTEGVTTRQKNYLPYQTAPMDLNFEK